MDNAQIRDRLVRIINRDLQSHLSYLTAPVSVKKIRPKKSDNGDRSFLIVWESQVNGLGQYFLTVKTDSVFADGFYIKFAESNYQDLYNSILRRINSIHSLFRRDVGGNHASQTIA